MAGCPLIDDVISSTKYRRDTSPIPLAMPCTASGKKTTQTAARVRGYVHKAAVGVRVAYKKCVPAMLSFTLNTKSWSREWLCCSEGDVG